MFHNLDGNGYHNVVAKPPFEGKPQSFADLSTLMSRMWISFIVHGDPNKSGGMFSLKSSVDLVTNSDDSRQSQLAQVHIR